MTLGRCPLSIVCSRGTPPMKAKARIRPSLSHMCHIESLDPRALYLPPPHLHPRSSREHIRLSVFGGGVPGVDWHGDCQDPYARRFPSTGPAKCLKSGLKFGQFLEWQWRIRFAAREDRKSLRGRFHTPTLKIHKRGFNQSCYTFTLMYLS